MPSGGAPLAPGDDYTPPDAIGPGSGFRFATSNGAHNDLGVSLPLTFATDPTNPNPAVNPIVSGLGPAARAGGGVWGERGGLQRRGD